MALGKPRSAAVCREQARISPPCQEHGQGYSLQSLIRPSKTRVAKLAFSDEHAFNDRTPCFTFLPHASSQATPHGDCLAGVCVVAVSKAISQLGSKTNGRKSLGLGCFFPWDDFCFFLLLLAQRAAAVPPAQGPQPADKRGFFKQTHASSQWNSYIFDNKRLKGEA